MINDNIIPFGATVQKVMWQGEVIYDREMTEKLKMLNDLKETQEKLNELETSLDKIIPPVFSPTSPIDSTRIAPLFRTIYNCITEKYPTKEFYEMINQDIEFVKELTTYLATLTEYETLEKGLNERIDALRNKEKQLKERLGIN